MSGTPVTVPFSINFPKVFGWTHFTGIGLAIGLSWLQNHSVLWAAFHGLISWIYIGYRFAPKVVAFIGG